MILAVATTLALTACNGNNDRVSQADIKVVEDKAMAEQQEQQAKADSMAAAATADSLARVQQEIAAQEARVIGQWNCPACDGDPFMWSTQILVFNPGGQGVLITTEHIVNDGTFQETTRKKTSSFSWKINGNYVSFKGVTCLLKGNKMYELCNGQPVYDDPCSVYDRK